MTIKIACPKCEALHKLNDQLAGKKIRCKECDRSFLVKPEDDEEEPEEERRRKPKRSKRKAQAAGTPVWVWAALGGGGALFLGVILVVVIVVVVRSRGNPAQANVIDDPARPVPNKKGGEPNAAAGPHAAIIEEFGASCSAVADALAQARDQGSADRAVSSLQQESGKMDQLATRLRTAGPAPASESARLRALQDRMLPLPTRMDTEVRQLQQRVPNMKLTAPTITSLDLAMKGYGNSIKGFVAVAKQNLP